ncbi:hypothetical protein [Azospirillum sp.]|uniref:hypothetical protein n=1 Tax=Azospirillum sp. TaxID=34012 RepID=UPI0026119EFB|nr:hypothetical protein [Azospirillum sp.]
MAKLSELMTCIAEASGIPESDIRQIGRRAREAGYIAQGARGTSAPDMGVADAANLLIAILASEFAKDAPIAIERYGVLRNSYVNDFSKVFGDGDGYYRKYIPVCPEIIKWVKSNHTFRDAVERLISDASKGEFNDLSDFMSVKDTEEKISNDIANYKYGNIDFNIVVYSNFHRASIVFFDQNARNFGIGHSSYGQLFADDGFAFYSAKAINKEVIATIGKLLVS